MGVGIWWKNFNIWVNYPFNVEECKETHERTCTQSLLDTHTVTHRSARQQLCGHVRQGPCCQWYAAVYGLTTASQTESSTRTTSCPEHCLTKTWLSPASAYQNHTLFLRWMEIWLGSQTKSELVDHITMKKPDIRVLAFALNETVNIHSHIIFISQLFSYMLLTFQFFSLYLLIDLF